MNFLLNYLTFINEAKNTKKWYDILDYQPLINTYYNLCKKYNVLPMYNEDLSEASRHPKEFCRLNFGPDSNTFYDMAMDLCKQVMFNGSLPNHNKIYVDDFEDYPNENCISYVDKIPGEKAYNVIRVRVNKNEFNKDFTKIIKNRLIDGDFYDFYIVNKNSSKSSDEIVSIEKYSVAPFKILDDLNKLYTIQDLKTSTINGIQNLNSINDDIKEFLIDIIKSIDETLTPDSETMEDLVQNHKKYQEIPINNKNVKLSSKDLDNISNWFGEIMGPIIIGKLLQNDCYVKYPSANTKVYDYFINVNGVNLNDIKSYEKISHKNGDGGKPSMLDYCIEIALKYPRNLSTQLPKNVQNCLNDVIYNIVDYTYVSALMNIYDKICPESKKTKQFLNDLFGGNVLKTEKCIFNTARDTKGGYTNSRKENAKLADFIVKLSENESYNYEEKYYQFLDDINYTFKSKSKDVKNIAFSLIKSGVASKIVGTIFIPIELAVKRSIEKLYNDEFQNELRNIVSGKQTYTTVVLQKNNGDYSLKYKIINLNNDGSVWEFRTKGYLTANSVGLNGVLGVGLKDKTDD